MNKMIKKAITRLQAPATDELIGRGKYLDKLDEAFENDKIAVVGITASGGTGKTALVHAWLSALELEHYGVNCVYAWQFQDRGPNAASSDPFFEDIFKFLGNPQSEIGSTLPPSDNLAGDFLSAEKKAELLFKKLSERQFVVILDSLESLQYHGLDNGTPNNGKLFDGAIKRFLTKLVEKGEKHTNRLVIVTSRERLVDLENLPSYSSINLDVFTKEEGADLFKQLKVVGTDKELQEASVSFSGHALALVLLSKLIISIFEDRNINHLNDINLFPGHPTEPGWSQAIGILKYYEEQVISPGEFILLKMMSLLHRPMVAGERNYLLQHADFTTEARGLSDEDWQNCHQRLEQFGLLNIDPQQPRQVWDCHPLIREHFRDSFDKESPESWRQAQSELFNYFTKVPSAYRPITQEELIPLYRAVHHACLAERFRDACQSYKDRILQDEDEDEDKAFSTNELGAISEDSAALRMFFQPKTTQFKSGVPQQLDIKQQAWLHARTSFCLTCLGRLHEAIEHRVQEIEHCQRQDRFEDKKKLWKNTAKAAGKLSELRLLVGDLSAAENSAETAIEYARQSEDWREQRTSRCRRAAVAHMKGQFDVAERLFQEALGFQQSGEPTRNVLYSDHGFLYRNFRLDQIDPINGKHEYEPLLHEAQSALGFDKDFKLPNPWLVAIGLDYLSKASIMAILNKIGCSEHYSIEAIKNEFQKAKDTLINSGSVIYLPEFFLANARSYPYGHRGEAINEVDEALKYATDYGMPLYQADAYLLKARLYLEMGKPKRARSYLADARKIIQERGYGRREHELNELEQKLV